MAQHVGIGMLDKKGVMSRVEEPAKVQVYYTQKLFTITERLCAAGPDRKSGCPSHLGKDTVTLGRCIAIGQMADAIRSRVRIAGNNVK